MKEVLLPWRNAMGLLQQRRRLAELKGAHTFRTAVDEAIEVLSKIKWAENLKGIERGAISTTTLHRFLTDKWLTDDNINQMLAVLQRELLIDGQSQVEVANIPFVRQLMKGYNACGAINKPDGKHEYETARSWRILREVGEELANGVKHEFTTVININGNHWIASRARLPDIRDPLQRLTWIHSRLTNYGGL